MLRPDASKCADDGAAFETVEKLPQGAKLGSYRIEKLLGEGGMGFVYEATHTVLNRRTAIKFLRPELAEHSQIVTRFLNEAKAVNLINHANIINVYDYGDGADGSVYFVMEYLEGETLDDLMRKRRPMAMPLFLHVFAQLLKALAAAHAKQIVHRDLKPANVYVVAREQNPYFIKVLDFGIAQLRGDGAVQGLTVAGSVMGTPQYMSPEQISGAAIDARTDVWALGVIMYRSATGHAPFRGEGFAELADKILHHPPKKPSEAAPDASIPAALDKLIMSCLERKTEDRCQSIKEMLEGLERVKTELKLDDDAIITAVQADAGAISEPLPAMRSAPATRASLAGSLPEYQGLGASAGGAAGGAAAPAAKSKLPLVIGGVGVVAAVGIAAFVFGGGGGSGGKANDKAIDKAKPDQVVANGADTKPAGPAAAEGSGSAAGSAASAPAVPSASIKAKFVAGDMTAVHALAEASLHDAMASGNLQQQGQAVDALALASPQAGAALLYIALKGSPEIRVKAARALGVLALPDGAPKVRAALDDSGDKVKVELAAVLSGLGDKDALAILKRAASDPGMRLTAALALADAGDSKDAKPVLADVLDATPPGKESWRRAAGGLVVLGDAAAKTSLEGELAQPDPVRAVAAAELLAKHGDDKGHAYLARVLADKDFARRGDASAALARLGDHAALDWVPEGLKSADVDERKLAIAACALLAKQGGDKFTGDLAGLASDDPDRSVRLTADAALLVW